MKKITDMLLPDDGIWLTYLALLFSIAAISLQLLKSRRPSKSSRRTSGNNDDNEKLNTLRNDLNTRPTRLEFKALAEGLKVMEDKIQQMNQPTREKVWDDFERKAIATDTVYEKTDEQTYNQETVQPDQEVFYAKLADLDDGFSAGIISSAQNGEQVYEIQPSGDTAVYRISNDPNAQKYALAESTFTLGKACDLINQPFKGCRIVLQTEGSLLKISGNWIIQRKAKIEFK